MNKSFGGLVLSLLLVSPAWAVLDLNTATQSELESVKGIGPAKAKAIIEYRQTHGPFRSVGELDKVKGFGKASVDRLKGELAVSPGKTAGPRH